MSKTAMLVLVDTSAWIGFFARSGYIGVKARVKMLLEDDQAATAGPIVLELLQGCRSMQERGLLETRLQALHWLDTQTRHWFEAGRTSFALRRAGITVAAIDILIATLAEDYGCGLLQLDEDFERIARHTRLHLIEVD